jgi:hypothetical protein
MVLEESVAPIGGETGGLRDRKGANALLRPLW